MHAPKTPVENIKQITNSCFEVQSSNSKEIYKINLNNTACSCSDFPYIQLCKHIAAIVHFFEGADLGPQPPVNTGAGASESVTPVSWLYRAAVLGSVVSEVSGRSLRSVA